MTLFWSIAALMVIGCLAWLLPVLISRPQMANEALSVPTHTDFAIASYHERLEEMAQEQADGKITQAQLDEAKQELDLELLQDVKPEPTLVHISGSASVWVTAIAIPVFAYFVYCELGQPAGMQVVGPGTPSAVRRPNASKVATVNAAANATTGAVSDSQQAMPSIENMVKGLAARLSANPQDAQGWQMLGRSYAVLNRMQEAEQAYARAYALTPNAVEVLTGYAEAIARNNNNTLQGRPLELVSTALKANPQHSKALWLAGIGAMQTGDGSAAAKYWKTLKETGTLNAEETTSIDEMIAEALAQSGDSTPAATKQPVPSAAPAAGLAKHEASRAANLATANVPTGVYVKVRVTLAPELAAKVGPGDSLFVFARAESGPPMPLAVVRGTAQDLPMEVILDESMAMMPQMTLATFPSIVIGARLSKTGNARASAGDLEGLSVPIKPKEQNSVAVTISRVVGS